MVKGKIPDRWEEYNPVGKVVAGTRFIAFKVPLNLMLSRSLPDDVKRFLPEDLPASIREEQKRELGIVIDLTNTTRYYRSEDIVRQNIEYVKIFTEGHSVPSSAVQNNFFETVDNFLRSNEDNDHVIGVHCTHGLNRTGYLVCRYMIDRMNFKADDAIAAFNEARGHDMERQNYLSDLRGRPTSDVSSPNKDRRMDRKRTTSTKESLEDSADAPRSESKQRCTTQITRIGATGNSFTRQSRDNDQWSHGHNRGQSGQNSQSHYGNGSNSSRNYRSNYRQNYQQHPQRNHYNDQYDYARQPRGYERQAYSTYQNDYASEGSWRKPRGYDQHNYDFASNDLSDNTYFGGAEFRRGGGGRQWGRRGSSPKYGQYQYNREAGRKTNYSDRHYQHSDSKK